MTAPPPLLIELHGTPWGPQTQIIRDYYGPVPRIADLIEFGGAEYRVSWIGPTRYDDGTVDVVVTAEFFGPVPTGRCLPGDSPPA